MCFHLKSKTAVLNATVCLALDALIMWQEKPDCGVLVIWRKNSDDWFQQVQTVQPEQAWTTNFK